MDDTLVVEVLDSPTDGVYQMRGVTSISVTLHIHSPLIVASASADPVEQLTTGTEVEHELQPVSHAHNDREVLT